MSPALVAVAHGSRDPAATRATEDLLGAVRRARPDLDVVGAYLDHARPALDEALREVHGPAVVVPLLLGAAYHSRVDIPAAIAASGRLAVQADVLGPDPLLLDALERRLGEVGVRRGDPATAVVLAAAGSSDPAAVADVRRLARGWADRGWWAVVPAFASAADPSVQEAVADLRRRGAPRVAVASYVLFPGLFADRLAAAGADVTGPPLGAAPELVSLLLARYGAAAALVAPAPTAGTTLPRP
ncbi:MAG TPA: sirohydrochlorin chelatase [Actinomycetes bacterium]|nr:sirohydrochlorin chelatase [Actinomycetes bacterium]